ncbi:unnamed protein product [Adineta steineri]|uniref:UTP--glucose-1-phosphate uridylyltransferase n=1 Tax=Adineta steineri TaxID=433720 RepID=A0A815UDQ4_9BILA|nr:unnamed protein product [Adineta steineri]
MFINRYQQLTLSKHIIARQKWTYSKVSSCGTYHICLNTQQPLYHHRFKAILPFHSPGLAPVIDQTNAAFHINDLGESAYCQRFTRTFGFYQKLAAVQNSDQWYHITPQGSSAYKSIWQWCGNFQSYRCPVRDFSLKYYHIDPTGRIISGPHSYAGDFREGSAVIRSSIDGLFRAIDENGDFLHSSSSSSSNKTSFFDLDVYHKGLARARDENGWFFIDRNGIDIGQGRRYRQIENFYNGQALVQLLHDGSRCIIDEQHQILATLHSCNDENHADIEQMAKAYWPSFALKLGLEQNINLLNDEKKSNNDNNQLREQIRQVWNELGFIKSSTIDGNYQITERGHLLFDLNSITRDRALYWLQDRYISTWLPILKHQNKLHSNKDTFSDIANNPELVALSQRVLNSYARQDWKGISSACPIELFQSSSIVDLGGGVGALLSELSKYCLSQHLICIDRPEVIRLAVPHPKIEFQSGDLFSGSLPSADLYLLSRVLHDWPDEKVKIILNRIPSKYLCVIEREVDLNINQHALLSLHMFLLQGAKERTRQEWNYLFTTTDWSVQSRTSFSGHTITLLKKDSINTRIPTSLNSCSKTIVRKVVLPTAGLGMRMRPQSTILPKVLLPITQSTSSIWKCRPVLDLLLEEIFAKETNIEQVLFVIAPEQLHLFQSYFSTYPQQKIDYIVQQSPKGFGHAVLQTEQYIDNEPFVIMLSDHLYQSNNNQSCLQQLLNAYRQNVSDPSRIGLAGIMTCTSEEVCATGLLQSNTDMKNKQFFEITDMIEKPSIELAVNRFQSGILNNHFLCQAGIDILPPTIFHELRQHEQKLAQEKKSVELGLREAMNNLRENGQLYGCLLDGHRYDIGTPKEYYRTFRAFAVEKKQKVQENSSISNVWSLVQQIDKVRTLFSVSKTPIYSASAPGRLDVMGGFADYSGSHVLQFPIAQRTHAFIQISNIDTIRMMSIQTDSIECNSINQNNLTVWEREIPMNLLRSHDQTLRERLETWYNQHQDTVLSNDEPTNWPSYILGILAELINKTNPTNTPIGFNVVIISDVPCNKGVASSAALEVAVARAASTCLNVDHIISNTELALLCQYVENHVVGSSCGFMDQMTCVHACADHLFSLRCQHLPNPPFHNITLPSNIQLFGIDSGVKRSTASSAYRRVRTAAFMGKQLLNLPDNIHHLCQITLSNFNNQYRLLLPEKMFGRDFQSSSHLDPLTKIDSDEVYSLRAATAHPIEENFRVQLFEQLLKNDHHLSMDVFSNLGELMFQSDAGYGSCDLNSEETNLLVNLIRQHKSPSKILFGAKITGGGGGGTVAVLAQNSSETIEAIQNIVTQYETITRRRTHIFSGSSSGLIAYPSMMIDI